MEIFISYSRVDRNFVGEFTDVLRVVYGHDHVWYDKELLGGDEWWQEILAAIKACDIFIYLLSNDSVSSPYCQAEFTEARRLQKRIITVQVRDRTKIPPELDGIQYLDLSDGLDDSAAVARLFASINKQASLAQKKRPLHAALTPRPRVPSAHEEEGSKTQAKISDLTLMMPDLPNSKGKNRINPLIIAAIITAVVINIAAVIGILPRLLNKEPTLIPTTITNTPSSILPSQAVASATVEATHNNHNYTPTKNVESLPSTAAPTKVQAYTPDTPTNTALPSSNTPNPTVMAIFTFTLSPTFTNTPIPPTNMPILPTALATTIQVINNAQWQPQFQDLNGVKMVLVPPGCFNMGSYKYDLEERPATEVCFHEPFWIDQYEVTQEQFDQWAGKASNPAGFPSPKHPRETISWFEARDFCAKRSARLLTEAEWEYAAAGPDSLIFPWGNDFNRTNVVFGTNSTANVGSKPDGASWVGALDMSGNVWEWVSSLNWGYPYKFDERESEVNITNPRVRRGGALYNTESRNLRSAQRSAKPPSYVGKDTGFRCARSN